MRWRMSRATHRSCVENQPTNIFSLSEIWFKHKRTFRPASYFELPPSTQPQFSQENDQAHLSASSGFSEHVHRLGIPQTSDALLGCLLLWYVWYVLSKRLQAYSLLGVWFLPNIHWRKIMNIFASKFGSTASQNWLLINKNYAITGWNQLTVNVHILPLLTY